MKYRVEIERGIPVTAKTVAELRALSTWPPSDFVLDVRIDPGHWFSVVMVDWPSYTSRWSCFIDRNANGQALAYVYFEQEPGRSASAKLLTRDEAWRIGVAKLPGLMRNRKGSSLLPEQFILSALALVAVRNIFSTRTNLTAPLDRRQQVTRRPWHCGIARRRARL
jgi:hypothetical protein